MKINLPSIVLTLKKGFFVASLSLLLGCAVSYKPLSPSALNYQNRTPVKDKLEVSYIYDIQSQTSNKRYAKKERGSGYAAIGLRVKNNTDQSITLTRENFKIMANGMEKNMVSADVYTKVVKQTSALYLLHTLWGPWSYSYIENPPPGVQQSSFKFYPVGAAVGLINLIVAESANKKHLTTLQENSIYGKTIEPGKTIFGIVIIPASSYEPLFFEFME